MNPPTFPEGAVTPTFTLIYNPDGYTGRGFRTNSNSALDEF
jgi:hypothetical protein